MGRVQRLVGEECTGDGNGRRASEVPLKSILMYPTDDWKSEEDCEWENNMIKTGV